MRCGFAGGAQGLRARSREETRSPGEEGAASCEGDWFGRPGAGRALSRGGRSRRAPCAALPAGRRKAPLGLRECVLRAVRRAGATECLLPSAFRSAGWGTRSVSLLPCLSAELELPELLRWKWNSPFWWLGPRAAPPRLEPSGRELAGLRGEGVMIFWARRFLLGRKGLFRVQPRFLALAPLPRKLVMPLNSYSDERKVEMRKQVVRRVMARKVVRDLQCIARDGISPVPCAE